MADQKIILKKSNQTGKAPTTSDLVYGELALNYTDGVLYYKASDNTIQSISGGGPVQPPSAARTFMMMGA